MRKRRQRGTPEQLREALAQLDAESSGDAIWTYVGRILPIALGQIAAVIALVVMIINGFARRRRGFRYLLTNRSTGVFVILAVVVQTTRIIVVRRARDQLTAAYWRSQQGDHSADDAES
ncbi:hypothetical protein [Microlunatus soli]|uniref:Uncharacterized protein n=1 Tax=Microlunatus soli TaxID=630515 RepID=A0A1H1RAN0_9ACTN|nr:hypothetical protein [Microlunatus soli]SDS32814.1 hypothetical protein SAMN04489812_1578 [Microlunatus soli]